MCGICGIINRENNFDLIAGIKKMTSILRHRGPDDEGYFIATNQQKSVLAGNDTPENVFHSHYSYCPHELINDFHGTGMLAFGHRRLSIIDVSPAGHQPMCSSDQQNWIVFNGEIYNYLEIREELKVKGYTFLSDSDTEVILTAYSHWGTDCVRHFNGMWAFVIYDHQERKLFGARDRLGVKPLYYYFENDRFLFASEQKALVKSGLVNTGLNERAVFDYLVLSHSQPEMEGFFKNIYELEQGRCFELELDEMKFRTFRFFNPLDIQELPNKNSIQFYSEELFSLLQNAVAIRTRSDVEVGACLSGGIDSSYIVMLLDDFFKKNKHSYIPKVFTAIYPGYQFDESKWAQKVVDHTSVEWFSTEPKADELLNDLQTMLYAADTPMLTTSTYAQFKVMQLAGETGIKVLLDGQGADELFAGYTNLDNIYLNELATRFRLLTLFQEISSGDKGNGKMKKWLLADMRSIVQGLPSTLSKFLYEQSVFELKYVRPELKSQFSSRFGKLSFPFGSNLNKVLKQYSGGEKLQTMLRLEDRMSMNFSVESRTPFSDDVNLISYALALPSNLKINGGVRKYILRESGRGFLPDEITDRKDKIGFQTPEQSWLASLKNGIPDLLLSNIDEFVDSNQLKNDLRRLIDSPTSTMNSRLLRFLFLSQWREVYQI